ncbi:MAG: carboxypeptidase M32 [Bacteroidetes bacterium]|nr:carboxypeptidase M32 [Bacteroidota bacterium]
MSYKKYHLFMRKIADVHLASAVLHWDQETYMPANGALYRAQQLSTLAGIAHDLAVKDDLGELLQNLNKDSSLSLEETKNVKESLKEYEKRKKYSTEFVEKMSITVSEAFQAWQKAKKNNDFDFYAPFLERIVDLKRQECAIIGFTDHPYDALLDEFEPGATTKDLEKLFEQVKGQLVDFVKKISSKPQNEDSFMFKHFDGDKQWDFSLHLLKQIGYDFDSGRQDKSSHPFTIHFNPLDVRVTTRVNENDVNEIIWSTIHEGGHALYEQGLNHENYGLPSGEYVSLGIHESQSRLYENNVGRSLPYWKSNFDKLQQYFPENLKNTTVEDFYKAMNIVKPSLIRTSADELTYHFHVIIRFELEKALIEGSIQVKDLPRLWNEKYKAYLGIDVPDNTKGVLQDVHWSHGSFGYFPTYSIGSFYAAQFFAKAKQDIPNLELQIEQGNMLELLKWLRENIHKHGKFYTAEELCIKVTGKKLNFNYFMEYATNKYTNLYKL